MKHRDDMSDQEMAEELNVPVALVSWVRSKDVSVPPPGIDARYDVGLQHAIVVNQNRVYDIYGLLDGTRPR